MVDTRLGLEALLVSDRLDMKLADECREQAPPPKESRKDPSVLDPLETAEPTDEQRAMSAFEPRAGPGVDLGDGGSWWKVGVSSRAVVIS